MQKTALIIGASRGLGLGLAKQFSSEGWQVIATVRNPQQAEALSQTPQLHVEALDMADASSVEELAKRLSGTKLDVLFVNAGVAGPQDKPATQVNKPRSANFSSPMPSHRCAWPSDCCRWSILRRA